MTEKCFDSLTTYFGLDNKTVVANEFKHIDVNSDGIVTRHEGQHAFNNLALLRSGNPDKGPEYSCRTDKDCKKKWGEQYICKEYDEYSSNKCEIDAVIANRKGNFTS